MSNATLSELIRASLKIGLLSFGGPGPQIALMQEEIVEKHGWIDQTEFNHALSFTMLLPGPEAMQLATYIGWKKKGVLGGLLSGGLFVLPGAFVIFALVAAYVSFGQNTWVQAAFLGIKSTVLIVVLGALIKIARKSFHGRLASFIALFSFLAAYVFNVPIPAIIVSAALIGFLFVKGPAPLENDTSAPSPKSVLQTAIFWAALWLVPVVALWIFFPGFITDIAVFFTKLATVSFGGAYAVLAFLTQGAVDTHGWISTPEMIDALGLAETTPGPLILVTQFVASLAGYKSGGMGLAFMAGLVTLWVTFIPCFLWVFVFGPFLNVLTANSKLAGALAMISAAIVGVIASICLLFAIHVLFDSQLHGTGLFSYFQFPDVTSVNIIAFALTALSAALLLVRKLDLVLVLPIMAGLGLLTVLPNL